MAGVQTKEEEISSRIRQIEGMLGYVKAHVLFVALNRARKETEALEIEV